MELFMQNHKENRCAWCSFLSATFFVSFQKRGRTLGFLLILSGALSACASFSRPVELKVAEGQKFDLSLVPRTGDQEIHGYSVQSQIIMTENGELVRRKQEAVDFDVLTEQTYFDPARKWLHVRAKTLNKDGMMDLNSMAFPEKGESIDFIYTLKADVVQAGEYPEVSIFYVAPLPLPPEPVGVGESWTQQASWLSSNGVPLLMDLVAILKNVYACGEHRCMEIEISGNVFLQAETNEPMNFISEISGRIIFSKERGTLLWSYVRSQESLTTVNGQVLSYTCVVGVLKQPLIYKWPYATQLSCDPLSENMQ